MYFETGSKNRQKMGGSFRKCFSTKHDALLDINKERLFGDVYISVYGFKAVERNGRWKPVYETAVVDKIFFDFDCLKVNQDNKSQEFFSIETKLSAEKLDDWLEKNNYSRQIFFSGGGYHIIPAVVGDPANLMKASFGIVHEVKISLDDSSLGDLSRLRRVPNTLNWGSEKKKRSVYCIPITREELHLPFEKMVELASRPRIGKKFKYGFLPIDLNKYSTHKISHGEIKISNQSVEQILSEKKDAGTILSKYGFAFGDLCPAITNKIQDGVISHRDRLDLIKYCRSILGLSYDDCVRFLNNILKPEVFEHCITERQIPLVYERKRVFYPERFKIEGLCPENCGKCFNFYKMRNGGTINAYLVQNGGLNRTA